jgi:hypothetical protein
VPHLTFAEIAALAGMRALWKAPDWGFKLLSLAYAIRRFRRSPDSGVPNA